MNRTIRHLFQKIQAHRDELEFVTHDWQAGATTLLISYGITARSMWQAARDLRALGKRVSTLTIQSLWPLPENSLRQAMRGLRRVIVPELNLGQYQIEIERVAHTLDPRPEVIGIHRVDGELITPREIAEWIV